MSARDELFQLMLGRTTTKAVERILAAGYRKPRPVNTAEELEALPDGSVVRDSSGDVAEKRGGVWCAFETAPMTNHRLAKYTPIIVLHEPEAP